MRELIDIFKMEEISTQTRAKLIIKLGRAINDTYCMNLTEPVVYELVKILEPENEELKNEHFIKHCK